MKKILFKWLQSIAATALAIIIFVNIGIFINSMFLKHDKKITPYYDCLKLFDDLTSYLIKDIVINAQQLSEVLAIEEKSCDKK